MYYKFNPLIQKHRKSNTSPSLNSWKNNEGSSGKGKKRSKAKNGQGISLSRAHAMQTKLAKRQGSNQVQSYQS